MPSLTQLLDDKLWFGTSYTSQSFATNPGDDLIAILAPISGFDDATTGESITCETTGLTWTSIVASTESPGWGYGVRAFRATDSAGGTRTIAAAAGTAGMQHGLIRVFKVTGHDAANPIGATGVAADADGDGVGALTLGTAPAADSLVVGVVNSQSNGGTIVVTPGTGWTRQGTDATFNDYGTTSIQTRTGSTSTSVTWDDLAASGSPLAAAMIAFEIKAAGGGSSATANPTGVSSTGSAGTLLHVLQQPITGVGASGAVGTLTASSGTVSRTPTGVAATGGVGTLTARSSATRTLAGVVGTGAAASLAPTNVVMSLVGTSATGIAGTASAAVSSVSVPVAGVGAVGSVGSLSVSSGAVTITLVGVQAQAFLGSITVTNGSVATCAGVSATGSVGTLRVSIGGGIDVPVSRTIRVRSHHRVIRNSRKG